MAKFRKKPIVIEAVQFKGFHEKTGEVLTSDDSDWLFHEIRNKVSFAGKPNTMTIKTLEGDMTASVGDWIIKGINGELYPCKPDIFEKTYDKVE